MNDARRKIAIEAADSYANAFTAEIQTVEQFPQWKLEKRTDYLQGWTDADSHPDTSASDEEKAREYVNTRVNRNSLFNHAYEDFLAGIAHARKSQAAEIARMRELLERAALVMEGKVFPGPNWLKDYAALKKELG